MELHIRKVHVFSRSCWSCRVQYRLGGLTIGTHKTNIRTKLRMWPALVNSFEFELYPQSMKRSRDDKHLSGKVDRYEVSGNRGSQEESTVDIEEVPLWEGFVPSNWDVVSHDTISS